MTEKETKDECKVVDVATQTSPAFQIGTETLDIHQVICRIYNILSELRRTI